MWAIAQSARAFVPCKWKIKKIKKLSLCPFPLSCPHSSNQHNAEKWACAPLRAHIGIYQFGHQRRWRPDLVAALIWCTQVWRSACRRDVKRYQWGGALAAVHYLLSERDGRFGGLSFPRTVCFDLAAGRSFTVQLTSTLSDFWLPKFLCAT